MRNHDAMLAAIAERAATPFCWRTNDCARFAAAIVEAQTGRTILTHLRWKTAQGAMRAIERAGGVEAAVSLWLRPVAPALAQRGDIAGVPDGKLGLRLMVVEGELLVGPGEYGILRQPRSIIARAWSAD